MSDFNGSSELILSQTGEYSRVFIDEAGQELNIFVETAEFAFRPKLVRSLRVASDSSAHYLPTDGCGRKEVRALPTTPRKRG